MKKTSEIIDRWRANKKSMRCDELVKDFESLGFRVSPKGSAGHHVAIFPGRVITETISFDCGHGNKNNVVKMPYVLKLIRFLETHGPTIESARHDDL